MTSKKSFRTRGILAIANLTIDTGQQTSGYAIADGQHGGFGSN
jgi:hypothetical protein